MGCFDSPLDLKTQGRAFLLSLLSLGITAASGLAQTNPELPACQPPAADEYLLLVVTPTAQTQEKLKQSLPPSVSVPACNYLGSQVSRMGGFRDVDNANAWSQYINEVVGLPAFVARPPSGATATTPPPVPGQVPTASAPTQAFAPKPLGSGYAVLVSYFNNPAIAAQLKQARQQTPGLVSYGQRPYLLAHYTNDSAAALNTLTTLTNQGFQALLVDSRDVMVLTEQVRL
jgi:hypothetical protein